MSKTCEASYFAGISSCHRLSNAYSGLKGTNASSNTDQYQWILPDGSSILKENFEIEIDEIVAILISPNDSFKDTLKQEIIVTDLTDIEMEKTITIYPNPTVTFVTLETTRNIEEIHICNLLRHLIWTDSNLDTGKYVIDM